jgi:hypothetical protein
MSTQNNLIIVIGNVKPRGAQVYKNKNKDKGYGMNLLVVNSLQLNSLVAKQFATKLQLPIVLYSY